MFSHFTLGTNDIERAKVFYSALMGTLDQPLLSASPEHGYLMFGPEDGRHPHLFVSQPFDDLPATWSNGYHIAFNARDTVVVDRFHAVALAHGGRDEGEPGLRSHYAADYYSAYVRDPDGNKLQAVCYIDGLSAANTGDVVSHITIGLGDLQRERIFYTEVLSALGYVELPEEGDAESVAFGVQGFALPVVYVQPPFDGRPATWGNGTHTAFLAPSRAAVDQFHAAALAQGGACAGPPGPRPHYSEHYYAAYVRDALGNKLQAVCRSQE